MPQPPVWDQQTPQQPTQPMQPPQYGGAPQQYGDTPQYGAAPQQPQYGTAPQWGQQWGQQQPQQPQQPQQQWGQQQWQIPQPSGYGWPAPPPPPQRRFGRGQLIATVSIVVLAVLGGGVYAYNHFASNGDSVSAVTCAPATLTSCLVAKPSSASEYTDSWGSSTTPTKSDYLKWAFDSDPVAQKTASDNLTSEGLQNIAHVAWKASDGNGIDITLLKFSGVQGAHARALELLGADISEGDAVSISNGVPGSAYSASKPNSDGDIVTRYSAFVGDIALQVRYYSPGSYSSGDLSSWLSAEYQSLTTAPKVTPSPQPTSTTQSMTCSSGLSSCLESAPSGSTPWGGSWSDNTSPTAAQYSAEMFSDTAWQTIIKARLNTAGLTGITHKTWITSNGAEADDVLLSFSTANGAMAWYKNDAYSATGTTFSIPGQQNATGSYDPKPDSDGSIVAQVYGVSGSVAMEMFTWSPGSFDKTRTVTWASQQLGKIGGTSKSQTAAVPAVPTPTAAASGSSGSCSSAESCLIQMPNGAQAWSGTDYDKTDTATVQQYVQENWSSESAADQAYEENLLNDAGVTAIAHREWDASDGTSAMLTVLQYGSPKNAQSEALDYQGAVLSTGTELTVPGLNDGVVDIKSMDDGGDIPVKVDVWKGNYEVRLSFYGLATADPQGAVSLALQQLAALPGS